MELRKSEEREEIIKDGQNIRGFQREIQDCFNKHLDDELNDFMITHGLSIEKNEDAVYWMIRLMQHLKGIK